MKHAEEGAESATDTRHERNTAWREQYLDLQQQVQDAEASGSDPEPLREQMRQVGGDFIAANMGLAVSVARPFMSQGDPDEYAAAATMGLWEAFLAWNPDKSTFGNFSRTYVKGRVSRTVRKTEFAHMGQGDFNRRGDVRNAVTLLADKLGRGPSHAEVARHLGVTEGVVSRALSRPATSLEALIGEDQTLGDTLADQSGTPAGEGSPGEESLADLNDLELWITLARYRMLGADEDATSLVAISDTIGKGREIVRRAAECAELRIAAAGYASRHGRNPTWDELLAETGRTSGAKGLTALRRSYVLSPIDAQRRWAQTLAYLRNARRQRDRGAVNQAAARLDRLGEAMLEQHGKVLAGIAACHVDHEGNPVSMEQAAKVTWESILTWDEERGTLSSWARSLAGSRWKRSARRDVPDRIDPQTARRLWQYVRSNQ